LQPFLHPVDPNEAPGYLTVVQNPICLDDIERKYERREYSDLASFEKDLKQICANCMIYNNEQTWYYKYAEKLLEVISENNKAKPKKCILISFKANSCDGQKNEVLFVYDIQVFPLLRGAPLVWECFVG
jgi:hypothetical protein